MGGLVSGTQRRAATPAVQTEQDQPTNLVDVSDPGQGYLSITSTAPGQQTGQGGGLEASTAVGSVDESLDSPLESFFSTSSLTREDVLVLAAVIHTVAWGALLIQEMSR